MINVRINENSKNWVVEAWSMGILILLCGRFLKLCHPFRSTKTKRPVIMKPLPSLHDVVDSAIYLCVWARAREHYNCFLLSPMNFPFLVLWKYNSPTRKLNSYRLNGSQAESRGNKVQGLVLVVNGVDDWSSCGDWSSCSSSSYTDYCKKFPSLRESFKSPRPPRRDC